MAARGRTPAAQTALLIVAPLLLLLYGGVAGWLLWTDQSDDGAPSAQTQQTTEPVPADPAETVPAPLAEPDAAAGHAESKTDGADKASEAETRAEPDHGDHAKQAEKPADPVPASPVPSKPEAPAQEPGRTGPAPTEPAHGDPGPADDQDTAATPSHDGETSTEHGAPEPAHDEPPEPARTADEPRETAPPVVPAAPKPAPVLTDSQDRQPLSPAPLPELTAQGPYGPLPVRGADGREPWRVYGRPFTRDADSRLIAIVITELGLAEAPTLSAIQDLPGEITLAFTPYSKRLREWVPAARAAGHEVLLQVPMEPRNVELNDPGDKALMTTNTPAVNLDRLSWVLSRATGYVGLTSFMGSRITVSDKDMRPVLEAIGARGLAYVDPRVTPVSIAGKLALELGLPAVTNDRFIDQQAAREPIDRRLAQLEQLALSRGSAVGFASAYPVTIERLRVWIPEMRKRGFELAPVTAVVQVGGTAE
ncbi:divergent polysaccharide deacetylase family protein [Minwuia sp.]|uniref:divergent polysaccharide deacetylase family protein n=1 Tax=Minwuia sp. TaxID=2493630 RepID=UPI003A959722